MLSGFFFLLLWIGFRIFHVYIFTRLKKIQKTKKSFTTVFMKIIQWFPRHFFWTLVVFFPLKTLLLPVWLDTSVTIVFTIVVALQLIRISHTILSYFVQGAFQDSHGNIGDKTKLHVIQMVVKIFVWIMGVLLILLNLWIEISPLLASLWIGWIAVAFALQSILADIFSSFSIFFDKPFKIGDTVSVGTDKWVVIDVSLKSTRIKTLAGEKLVIPNKDVMNSRIRNYEHVFKRRVDVVLQIVYQTPLETLETIPTLLTDIVTQYANVSFDWAVFKAYSASSLDFHLVYHVTTDTYKEFLLVKEKIYYDIFRVFAQNKIQFAYPTQTIHTVSV